MKVFGFVNGSPGTIDSGYNISDTYNIAYCLYFGIYSVHVKTIVFGISTGKFLFYSGS